MLEKIDHLGIVVHDLKSAMARYAALSGHPADHVEDVIEQKVRVAMFNVGESRIELLMATAPDSPVAKFIKNRGEGLHHVCFKVANLDEAVVRLQREGMQILPDAGAKGAEGSRIAFLHPKSTAGVLIELAETSTP